VTGRLVLPVLTLWGREVVRFRRQRSRVMGALAQPVLLWVLLGAGFRGSFRLPGTPAGPDALQYFYPGILALTLLFTAIFATISTVEDRREGFLQGVLVAPIPRASIVLGQALGGTTLAVLQAGLALVLAPLAGIALTFAAVLAALGSMALIAFGLTSLGLVMAWRLESTQGFHALMNLILIPIWLLSGAFFPAAGAAPWLGWAMRLDPLTYGMAALRRCLFLGDPAAAADLPALGPSLLVTALFGAAAFLAATAAARRHTA
jgi:ABC-2 type transport system permease protein